MVLGLTESSSDRKHSGAAAGSGPRETLQRRLREAGLDVERFVDLTDGTKASYRDHNDPRFQFEAAELSGSYGVLAGDGLVIFDIDDWETVPEWLEALPDTYTVQSPHGGEHRYYAVDGDVSGGKCSKEFGWGHLLVRDVYAAGPGSELTDCKHGCCSSDSPGEYSARDLPVARIGAEDLPGEYRADVAADDGEEVDIPDPEEAPDELDFSDVDTGLPVQQRWETLLESERGEEYRLIADGRLREAGYVADDGSGDRSEAEFALCEGLAWVLHDQKEVVAEAMNRICRANPTTDGDPEHGRKWLENPGNYRNLLLDAACDHSSTYDPGTDPAPLSYEELPEVSWVTSDGVLNALLDLGAASTAELAEHEEVDRSRRQVRRALDQLIEDGHVASVKDGCRRLYYFTFHEAVLDELL